jgi:hypothetical protein
MKKEFIGVLVVGMLVLAYVLDAIVNPLAISLPTPYHFFTPEQMFEYAFTSTGIVLKAVALTLAPIWILSMMGIKATLKGSILLVISALLQLYALQDVVSRAYVLPLEWSLAFCLTGLLLLVPALLFLIFGMLGGAKKKLTTDSYDFLKDDSRPGDDL